MIVPVRTVVRGLVGTNKGSLPACLAPRCGESTRFNLSWRCPVQQHRHGAFSTLSSSSWRVPRKWQWPADCRHIPASRLRIQLYRQVGVFSTSSFVQNDTTTLDETEALDPYDEKMLNELHTYKEKHGDCHVPAGTGRVAERERERLDVSDELATWVARQRQRYKDIQNKKIKKMTKADQIRIVVLESMGFMWLEREAQWQRFFNRLEAHLRQHGNLELHREEHPQLWHWADQQRKAFAQGRLSDQKVNLLKELDFVFDLQEAAWWNHFDRVCDYAQKYGDPNVPVKSKDDPSLGAWVARQRTHYNAGELSQERIDALEKIGFSFDVHGEKWMKHYKELVAFYEKHGHTRVPVSEGQLWQWVDRQRRKLRQTQAGSDDVAELSLDSAEKITALNKIHFDWSVTDDEDRARRLMDLTFSVDIQDERWIENYKKLCDFKERFGHFSIPPNHPDYQELASWAKHQRFLNKRRKLSPERIAALDELGFIWSGQGARWDRLYQEVVRFHAKHGHTRIPTKQRELYRWANQQRKALKDLEKKASASPGLQFNTDDRLLELGCLFQEDED